MLQSTNKCSICDTTGDLSFVNPNLYLCNTCIQGCKACRRCKSLKLLSSYKQDRRSKDGYQSTCKECLSFQSSRRSSIDFDMKSKDEEIKDFYERQLEYIKDVYTEQLELLKDTCAKKDDIIKEKDELILQLSKPKSVYTFVKELFF